MAKKVSDKFSLSQFPEEIDKKNNIKIYGEASFENQMAVLSQYIHNPESEISDDRKHEIILAIGEFLYRKANKGIKSDEITDNYIWQVAEDPIQYNLFNRLTY